MATPTSDRWLRLSVFWSPISLGAQYDPLHYRHLERDKYSALVANKGDYSSVMHLSQPALTEIQCVGQQCHARA